VIEAKPPQSSSGHNLMENMSDRRISSLESTLNQVIEASEDNHENVFRARVILDSIQGIRSLSYNRSSSDGSNNSATAMVSDVETHIVRSLSSETNDDFETVLEPDATVTIGVYSWGRYDLGCLLRSELNSEFDATKPIQGFEKRKIRQIASSTFHTAALTNTGEVFLCGDNSYGQVSDELGPEIVAKPRVLESLLRHRICHVSCGPTHTALVTAAGKSFTFGSNEVGELGHSGSISPCQQIFRHNRKFQVKSTQYAYRKQASTC
jgi:Regulator of chromosome condensation (RCC1) repeat